MTPRDDQDELENELEDEDELEEEDEELEEEASDEESGRARRRRPRKERPAGARTPRPLVVSKKAVASTFELLSRTLSTPNSRR